MGGALSFILDFVPRFIVHLDLSPAEVSLGNLIIFSFVCSLWPARLLDRRTHLEGAAPRTCGIICTLNCLSVLIQPGTSLAPNPAVARRARTWGILTRLFQRNSWIGHKLGSIQAAKPVLNPVERKLQPGIILPDIYLVIQAPIVVEEADLELLLAEFSDELLRRVFPQESFQAAGIGIEVLAIPLEDGADFGSRHSNLNPATRQFFLSMSGGLLR